MTSRDLALALLIPLVWGFNFIVMKFAVTEASPMFLVAARFLLATVPLIFFVPRPEAPWMKLALYAFIFAVVKFSLLFSAFRLGAPAGISAVVLQMQAIVTVGLSLLLFRERPSGRDVAGLALAAAGLAIILAGLSGGDTLIPLLIVFAAATAWASANLVNKSLKRADPIGFVVWTSALATLMVIPIILLVEGLGSVTATIAGLSTWGWAAILYLAYPVSIVSGAIWSRLIIRYPSATITPFALATPAVALVMSMVFYGEPLTLSVLLGSAAILMGIALNTLPRNAPGDAAKHFRKS